MSVKRYMVAQCCGFGELEESPHGDFVHIDDYDALAAELEAVRAERDQESENAKIRLKWLNRICAILKIDAGGYPVLVLGDRLEELESVKSDLDALTAELARVKAESLRVVEVGKPVRYDEIQDGILFRAEGEVACKNGQRSQYSGEADSWHFSREYKSGVVPITMFSRTAIIQPVRLERWEEET